VKKITLSKYLSSLNSLRKIAPSLTFENLNKRTYQEIINEYSKTHEKQTVRDFHRHLRASILDAIDEKLIDHDPTRKTVIKGKQPSEKKQKFLSLEELQRLLRQIENEKGLHISPQLYPTASGFKKYQASNYFENQRKELSHSFLDKIDLLIILIAKTGMRFAEALALTSEDFKDNTINIMKTWDYKSPKGGFLPTKNESSNRVICIDNELSELFLNFNGFVSKRVFNSTVNKRLQKHCENAGIPIITAHSLRHTHASILIFAGVSIASVSKRLGHSSITTTQETYLHIIKELEDKDREKIVNLLSELSTSKNC